MPPSSAPTTVHDSRTIMLQELERLFEATGAGASETSLREAVMDGNALHKTTQRARLASFRYLRRLYGLDRADPIYRAFRQLWDADPIARPQLALLMALRRDTLMRQSATPLLNLPEGQPVVAPDLEVWLWPEQGEGRGKKTRQSASRNLLSSWRQAGVLRGVARKKRARLQARPAAVVLALREGYAEGVRGVRLFDTLYVRALDSSPAQLDELARQAAVSGWLHYRRIADVVDVFFEADGPA